MKYTIVTLSALVATTSAQQYPCKGNWVPGNEMLGQVCGGYDDQNLGVVTDNTFQTMCATAGAEVINQNNDLMKTCCENEDVYLCPANTAPDNGGDGSDDDSSDVFPCKGGEGEKMPSICADPTKLVANEICTGMNNMVRETCLLTEQDALCSGLRDLPADEQALTIACCSDGKLVCDAGTEVISDEWPCKGGEGEKMPGMCADGTTLKESEECKFTNDLVTGSCLNTEVEALCTAFAKATEVEAKATLACCDGKIICTDEKFMEKHAPNFEYKGPGSASGTLSLAFGALAAVGLSYVCNML